ncbi:hypothetical protein ES705_19419 [subsurface metagenome]
MMSLSALGLAWEQYHKSKRESWEQTRIMTYYMAAPYFKEEQTMKKFMPLAWDSESEETEQVDTKVSSRERFDEITMELNLN